MKIKRIYTLKQAAKALGKSKQALDRMNRADPKRLKHDIEDQDGKPYWSTPPQIEKLKAGRHKKRGSK